MSADSALIYLRHSQMHSFAHASRRSVSAATMKTQLIGRSNLACFGVMTHETVAGCSANG